MMDRIFLLVMLIIASVLTVYCLIFNILHPRMFNLVVTYAGLAVSYLVWDMLYYEIKRNRRGL